MRDLTQILNRISGGEQAAAEELLPAVYEELRRLAHHKMANEQPGQTLDATGLVHEAYLRLIKPSSKAAEGREPQWDGRGHFFAAAAEAMRRILVEKVRQQQGIKHGGAFKRVELRDPAAPAGDEKLLALDAALDRLAEEDRVSAQIVELKYFAGLSHEQSAETLGMTVYAVRKKWTYARAWLTAAMADVE